MSMAGIDDFLGHRTSDRGAYLSGWKKDGKVNTWLHTGSLPMAVWRHGGIPRIVVKENKNSGEHERHVWSGDWCCHEPEDALKAQYRYEDDGKRTIPPLYCPICRLIEYVRLMCKSGRWDWLEPVFRFEADDADETLTLFAGAMWMTRRDFDELEKDDVKKAKDAGLIIGGKGGGEAWKQNAYAGCRYLFLVVDDAHPESGVQKAFETSSLGDAVKDVITDARESKGAEGGDPLLNPYCIQWIYNERDPDPRKKYHARMVEKVELTPAIEALIRGPAPDVTRDIKPYNIAEMRTFLEECALMKFPWDQLFDVKVRPERGLSTSLPSKSAPKGKVAKAVPKRAKSPEENDPHAAECEGVLPDGKPCGMPMWDDDTVCPHCDAHYELIGGKYVLVPRAEPKRGMRKRGDVPADEPEDKPVKLSVPKAAESTRQVAPAQRRSKVKDEPPASSARLPEREAGQDDEEDDDPLPF